MTGHNHSVTLEYLVQNYGYFALAVGTFLEGETMLIIAGFLAHQGYLSLPWVFVVAFIGSFSGDQLWFQVGRRKGMQMIEARPHWKQRAIRIRELLERHRIPVLLGFRFVYGFRNLTPFVIGATGFRARPFVILNALGALIWSVSVATAGYFFGEAVKALFHDVKKYELLLLAGAVVVGMGIWGFRLWRRRRAAPPGGGADGPSMPPNG